ncbi:hypothetical protein ASPZODRAFT_63441 [Penicilliopsis zonata CBS 506.65]|uniref:Uncharacterized protein n=1 Tax=Penicilliopsis zonata CBS 506.65 TaxID=1073090 RepID=A0A1L9SL59_9EURO|nr:hypothetical protein ASPZODRAFT_63441 [Penicilliopsis zonata CBS 506.65]OJJ47910.1 hypothetical protein ASPZODRAFT_63441 [Penicilliopsis zonata CBS 506.65]
MSQDIKVDNPFQPLITETNNDPAQLQSRYETHRNGRNAAQTAQILDTDHFAGWKLDTVLMRMEGPHREEGFVDPRNCLVFWARPTAVIREMIAMIQRELQIVAPTLWTMPNDCLHMTILEAAHSLTEEQIQNLVTILETSKTVSTSEIANYALAHRCRVVKPMISFDASAMALSFVPAAGEGGSGDDTADGYTYHDLRRDIFDLVRKAGVRVESRYSVPSAHITIARFITQNGFTTEDNQVDHSKVKLVIEKINDLNRKLQEEYWPQADGSIPAGGEWKLGQERGLVIRRGRLWYGGGEDVQVGEGF